MTTVDAAQTRVWLQADVPRDMAEEFAARAKQEHRTARAQLRVLVEEFLARESESPAGEYGGRSAV